MPEGYIRGKLDVSWWTANITAGIEFRKKYAMEPRWETWRSYYRGNWNSDVMASNVFFKMLRTVVPRIYFRNPSVSITSGKPGLENMLFAQLLERIDNKLIKQMKLKKQIKKIVQDTFMFGTGVGKLGYGAQFTPSPEEFETTQPYGKKNTVFEYNQNVHDNMPWFLRTHPGSFIVPSGLCDFDDTRFCIHMIERPLSDVKDDPRFKHVKNLKGGKRPPMQGMRQKNDSGVRQPVEIIQLFEIRDKKTGMVFVIAPYATNDVLYAGDDDLQSRGRLNFYTLTFNDDDEVFWAPSDSKILEPLQLEINENNTQIMKHRRLSLIKIIAQKNAFTPAEKVKLVDESVEPVVEIEGNPLTDIRILEGSNIPDDLFKAFEATLRDIRETVGFSRNEFGEFNPGSGDTTATEAMIIRQASEIRVDERRDMTADMIVDVIDHMHSIIFEQWNDEQIVDIIGPNGIPIWVKFKPSMLKGNYEVNIDPDTSLPQTKQVREQKATQIYGMLRDDPMIDQMQLRRYLLHEFHGTAFDNMLIQQAGMPGTQQNPVDIREAMQLLQGQVNSGGGAGG